MKKLIGTLAVGIILAAAACGLPPGCPWLTIEPGCYNANIKAGSFHTKATADGEYALEINYADVLRRVEGATLVSAKTGDPLTFTTAYTPFRIVYRQSSGFEWLPASNEIPSQPESVCILL